MTTRVFSRCCGATVLLVSILPMLAPPPAAAAADRRDETKAQHLQAGAVARSQVVGLGRDVLIDGEALSDVAALNGSVRVSGTVRGDVIVLGGDVLLEPTAVVEGEVLALGGTVDAAPGATLGGRSVAYPSASAAWVTLLEAPALGGSSSSTVLLAAKVVLLAAWMALLLLLFGTSGRQVLSTAEAVRAEPFRSFWLGLGAVVTLVLTGLLIGTLAGPLIGLPWLVVIVLTLLLAKLWGMVAVFYALGHWVAGRLGKRLAVLHAGTLGLLVLGALKLIPQVGLWVWSVATLIGVGASLATKFGRREPWFDPEPLIASSLAARLADRPSR
ncbi:MAG: polymer-forming cytoskeletal protein [Acidobacteria bacterium]|nr:polymer-forming cytoskeletal protein [Acidobacteriota bacterium]